MAEFTPIKPVFEIGAMLGIGVPLYLVTMAMQNLPGFAVLRSVGYPVPGRSILLVTGVASAVTAFLGGTYLKSGDDYGIYLYRQGSAP